MVTFDPDALKARLDELEQELAQPDFWSDQQRAAGLCDQVTFVISKS